jgi:hypothetical protein
MVFEVKKPIEAGRTYSAKLVLDNKNEISFSMKSL